MQILSIQSHVVYGYVGNRAAVFPLQRLGFDVMALNTVQFSNHTGYGSWKGYALDAATIRDILNDLQSQNRLLNLKAILTGYMGNEAITNVIAEFVGAQKIANPQIIYTCDPVMGDIGRGFFVDSAIPPQFKNNLCPNADIITPNVFELAYLNAQKAEDLTTIEDIKAACDSLHMAGQKTILVTSVAAKTPSHIGMLLSLNPAKKFYIETPKFEFVIPPNGSGDAASSLFLGQLLKTGDSVTALEKTATAMHHIFKTTHKKNQRELALIESQYSFNDKAEFNAICV